LLLKKRGL
jgi:hypothetical protein